MTEIGEPTLPPVQLPLNQCTSEGHPVDVATGNVFAYFIDAPLSRLADMHLERTYNTSWLARQGLFGVGWLSTLDIRLAEVNAGDIELYLPDGRRMVAPNSELGAQVRLPSGFCVTRERDRIRVVDQDGLEHMFERDRREPRAWQRVTIGRGGVSALSFTYVKDAIQCVDGVHRRCIFQLERGLVRSLVVIDQGVAAERVRYTYDCQGRLVDAQDCRGRRFQFVYDSSGRMITEVQPSGRAFQFAYRADGRCVKTQGPDRLLFRAFEYDTTRKTTLVTNSRGGVRTYHWQRSGAVTAIEQGGEWTRFHRNESGQIEKHIDACGQITQYRYDDRSVRVEKIDPTGHKSRASYSDSRITQTNGEGQVAISAFDAEEGALVRHDSAGNILRQEPGPIWKIEPRFGEDDQMSAIDRDPDDPSSFSRDNAEGVVPGVNPARLVFDTEAELVGIKNESGEVLTLVRGTFGEVRRIEDFDGSRRVIAYDACGRISSISGDDGTLRVLRDRAGRIVEVHGSQGASTPTMQCTYRYDRAGRLIEACNAAAVCGFAYDALDRIVEETRDGELIFSRSFDRRGDLVKFVNVRGQATTFSYNPGHTLASLEMPGSVGRVDYERDNRGYPHVRRCGGVARSVCTHDAHGRLLSQEMQGQDGSWSRHYVYDRYGRLVRLTDSEAGVTTYIYNELGYLSGSSSRERAVTYRYDARGNRTGIGADSVEYAAGNRVCSINGQEVVLDAAGNVRSSPARCVGAQTKADLLVDGLGQLSSVVNERGAWAYEYDAVGRRIAKVELTSGERVRFLWDGLRIYAELGASGELTQYLYHPTRPVLMGVCAGERAAYCFTNQAACPRELVDASGRRIWTSEPHDLHGCVPLKEDLPLRLRLPGHYLDPESGYFYNVFRYYDPWTGRYLSKDPLGPQSGDINLYRYAMNDPINKVDILGLGAIVLGGEIGSVGGPVGIAVGVGVGVIITGILWLASRSEPVCPPKPEARTCPPCPAPPPPRIDKVPPSRPHWPCPGDHAHFFVYNQNPTTCECFLREGGVTCL